MLNAASKKSLVGLVVPLFALKAGDKKQTPFSCQKVTTECLTQAEEEA